jgi:sporulation protein YlmC with PRC-barrel domain
MEISRVFARLVAALLVLVALPALGGPRVSVSELIGRAVADANGNAIGELTDVIFDARDGTIRAVTVDFGRWLRVGSREAAFPLAQISSAGEPVVLDVPERELRRAPPAGRPEWPSLSAAWLIGREVRDRLHRDSGDMVDLVADLAAGRIVQAVIRLPAEWAADRVPLPLDSLTLPREIGQYATLDVTRERLAHP